MTRLLLWDIDGTLIRSNQVGTKAMHRAMQQVAGTHEPMTRISMAGMVDWSIWREALGELGYSHAEVDAWMPELRVHYLRELRDILDSPAHANPEPLPGVLPLLETLHARDDVLLALLTGNIEPAAWLKLERAGLAHFFHFGAFGDDAPERAQLPAIAVERAAFFFNGDTPTGKDVVIIGDTVHDIHCGAAHGVTAIGVATGQTDVDTLRAAGADAVFAALEPMGPVLDTLVGRSNPR